MRWMDTRSGAPALRSGPDRDVPGTCQGHSHTVATGRPSVSPRAEHVADTACRPGVPRLLGLPDWAPWDPGLTSGENGDVQTSSPVTRGSDRWVTRRK